ncbi:MAG TPA: LytTR family DNA-binding domain-containing protein [Bacteroidales bacterium]|nr:LytTR family DNA-binding domain-containing protein [Bacteroidales bacterium]
MFKFLNKPYPFNDDLKYNSKLIFFISIGVLGFLYLFQPLDVSLMDDKEKLYVVSGLAAITFLSLSLNLLILPSLFPGIFIKRVWNIKKEILWNLWILTTISVGYYLYYKVLGIFTIDFKMILGLIVIAIIPITGLIIVNRNRMLRSNLKLAERINKKLEENKSIDNKLVHFQSEYAKDNLSIKVNLLILIRAANNYIEVFWVEGEKIRNQMIRTSLKNAEELLDDYSFIFKCHRSFMVNTHYINRIEGNVQGYKIHFEKIDFPVPVSKKFAFKLKQLV